MDLHISGESYAGHYVPSFANAVHKAGIPLNSILIGNGVTDPVVQLGEVSNMGCGQGGIGKIYTDKECTEYPEKYEICTLWRIMLQEPKCFNLFYCCIGLAKTPDTGDLNPYDSRVKCGNNSLCYDQIDYLNDYFNLQSVQEL